MAAELVRSATSKKLKEMDWMKNIEISELVASDHSQAKDVVKAIKKRFESNNRNHQYLAVMLLEILMHNIGGPVHKEVVEAELLPVLVKIVKKKSEHPVRERIFLLLDAAQTSVGGATGTFPEYYSAYYELVCAGVKFPERPRDIPKPQSASIMKKKNPSDKDLAVPQAEGNMSQVQNNSGSDPSRVLLNAAAELEVLRDVLDAIDTKYPEAAKDEFTLDLVEQCCFQKQRVMHLAVNSLDEVIIAQAVVVNEQLDIVLKRHYALLDGGFTMLDDNNSNKPGQEQEEEAEEDAERRFQRIRKGKACVQPEDEGLGAMGPMYGELLRRPLIRPVNETHVVPPSVVSHHELAMVEPTVVIPPPPAKHAERERFFQGSKSDGSGLSGRMSSLSLDSRDAGSTQSGSTDFSDI